MVPEHLVITILPNQYFFSSFIYQNKYNDSKNNDSKNNDSKNNNSMNNDAKYESTNKYNKLIKK
jgi:hypothetical protein